MSNVRLLTPVAAMPADFPAALRDLADRVERGEVSSAVVAFCTGHFEFLWPSSLVDSLVLTDLLHDAALARMKHQV